MEMRLRSRRNRRRAACVASRSETSVPQVKGGSRENLIHPEFHSAEAGVGEMLFQGRFQFEELASMVPADYSGERIGALGDFDCSAAYPTRRPLQTASMDQRYSRIQTRPSQLDAHSSPFDNQKLKAAFEVVGFDADLILLQASSAHQKERLSRGRRTASNDVLGRKPQTQRLSRHCPPAVVARDR